MRLFQSNPSLPPHEKARIEFHLQQTAERIGFKRFLKPVLDPTTAFGHDPRDITIEEIHQRIAEQLSYDVTEIDLQVRPKQLETCGGGG